MPADRHENWAIFDATSPTYRHDVVVRLAHEDDAEALSEIVLGIGPRSAEKWAERARESGAHPHRVMYTALVGGAVAGEAEVRWWDEHEDGAPAGYYLAGVNVIPRFRRGGVARALIRTRLDWIAERADEAWYFASAANVVSLAAHEEFGFTRHAEGPHFQGIAFDAGRGYLLRASLTV